MNEPRSAGGLVSLSNGCLYAVGGHNGLAIYSSVECYQRHAVGPSMYGSTTGDGARPIPPRSTSSNPWHPVARMIHRRCRHGVAALRNRIIVAGGYNGVTFLRSVEIFDPVAGPDKNGIMGQWTEIAPMGVPRSRVGLAVTGGRLYAIGGYDGTSHLSTVECFHPPSCFTASSVSTECTTNGVAHRWTPVPSKRVVKLNRNASASTVGTYESASSDDSGDNDGGDTASVATSLTSAASGQSPESQTISQLESRSIVNPETHRLPRISAHLGIFANWKWSPAVSLIAHEGWVGVGVLPLDETPTSVPGPTKMCTDSLPVLRLASLGSRTFDSSRF